MTVSDPPGQKAAVRDFFNDGAESWQARYARRDFESVSYQDRMAAALGFLRRHVPAGAQVLDAGCGAGIQAAAIHGLGYRVVACDLAAEMAKKARANIRGEGGAGRALVADLDRSPFRPGAFDAAVSLGVIGYANDPDALLAALHRALKPGGVLVISTAGERLLLTRIANFLSVIPDRIYLWIKHNVLRRKSTPRAWDTGFYQDHYRYTTAPEFDRFLARGGFRKLDSTGVNYGRLHFMDKHPWPERLDVMLTHLVAQAARRGPLWFLQRWSRIYVTCVVKEGPEPTPAPAPEAVPDTAAWRERWSRRVNAENLERVTHVLELLPEGRKTLLEVGARTGLMTELLVRRFPSVTALDLARPAFDIPGADPVAGDVTALAYPDDHFDVVVCEEVLEHVPPDRVAQACRELARVARHEAVIGVPNRQDLRARRLTCRGCGRTCAPYGHLGSFDEARLLALFPGLTPARVSVLGPPQEQTNALSWLVMRAAGNPWGDYDQHEPCPYCDRAYRAPRTGLLRKVLAKPAFVLHKAQNRLWPGPPAWLHVVFRKGAAS